MNTVKRIITILLLSLTLAATVLPAPVFAEDDGCSNCHPPIPKPDED
jgi:hypothetical protein